MNAVKQASFLHDLFVPVCKHLDKNPPRILYGQSVSEILDFPFNGKKKMGEIYKIVKAHYPKHYPELLEVVNKVIKMNKIWFSQRSGVAADCQNEFQFLDLAVHASAHKCAIELAHEAVHVWDLWNFSNTNILEEAAPRTAEKLLSDNFKKDLGLETDALFKTKLVHSIWMDNPSFMEKCKASKRPSKTEMFFHSHFLGTLASILLTDMINAKEIKFNDILHKKGEPPLLTKMKNWGIDGNALKQSVKSYLA